MVDLHSHILPQVDDGSRSVEETMQMLSLLASQGVETVVATPHFYAWKDTLEAFLSRRQKAYAQLPQDDSLPKVCLGAEVTYFNGISRSTEIAQLQLGQTKLLLIEMPFDHWNDKMVQEICDIPAQIGLQPVLAHVDRYRHRNQMRKYAQRLLSSGVYFQCNADAFTQGAKSRWALKQIALGNIHFLGSDCHNLTDRPPLLQEATEKIRKKLSGDALDRITLLEKQYF